MPRGKKLPPPAGGAIVDDTPVNPQVLRMTGHQSESEMVDSLPTDTRATSEDDEIKPKRTYRKRKVQEPEIDPFMSDKQYRRAVGKATFLGAPKGVKGGFKIASKIAHDPDIALDVEEEEDVDDFFYAFAMRRSLGDPFERWWTALLYFMVMMATFIGTRFARSQGEGLQKEIAKWFGYKKDEEEEAKGKVN